jgi:hypothetical protein
MYNFVLFVDIKQHFDYTIEKMIVDIELIHLKMGCHRSVDLLQIFRGLFWPENEIQRNRNFNGNKRAYHNKTLFL